MNRSYIFFAIIAFTLAAIVAGGVTYFMTRPAEKISLIGTQDQMQTDEMSQASKAVKKQPIMGILLLGVGGEGHDGGNLTDTIMAVKIDNQNQSISTVSLPRDLLVFDEEGYYYKINSLYNNTLIETGNPDQAIQVLQDTVREITGIPFDHYAKVDFEGFVTLIDVLGGVEVEVTETIDDPYYPGPNYSYEPFYIEKGTQQLDGETALKYARSRYASAGGDLDRARRQQQIIDEVRKKIADLHPVWDLNKVLSLLNIAKNNLETDLSFGSMQTLYEAYQDVDEYEMYNLVLGGDLLTGSLKERYRWFGRSRGYVIEPRAGEQNYLQLREEVAHMDEWEEYQQKSEAIQQEQAAVTIVSRLSDAKTQELQQLLAIKGISVTLAQDSQNKSQKADQTNKMYVSDIERYSQTAQYIKELLDAPIVLEAEAPDTIRDIPANHAMLIYLNEPSIYQVEK